MKPVCGACGGPLFRRVCLGYCVGALARRSPAMQLVSSDAPRPVRESYELEWTSTFSTPKGLPLNVARWNPFVLGPGGHRVQVWNRLLARVA